MTMTTLIALIALALALWMAFAWTLVLQSGKSGWADVLWSFGIGLGGTAACLVPVDGQMPTPRAILAAVLIAVWALRLGLYILGRTLSGGEDPRYAELRRQWGRRFAANLLGFLEIQALAALLLVLSVMAAAYNSSPLGWTDGLGVAIAVIAIAGESLSDRQMRAFKADPGHRGQICDTGLWSLSRHPNYFFEWLVWLAYVPIGLAPGYGWGWASLIAPVMMYVLLVHISGVPPLEAHLLRSRGEAFRAYQARVRAFWPIPKKLERNA